MSGALLASDVHQDVLWAVPWRPVFSGWIPQTPQVCA